LRFLADENIPPAIIARLRSAGLAVEAVIETSPGVSDIAILQRADIVNLILITFDSDFDDLIFNHSYPNPAAILYIRLSSTASYGGSDYSFIR
jgi:predicted nuclease of predicted toxin-antitoxin system